MKNKKLRYKANLELKLWPDAIPIIGIGTSLKRNKEVETENLSINDFYKSFAYAFYHVGASIVLVNYLLERLEKIF